MLQMLQKFAPAIIAVIIAARAVSADEWKHIGLKADTVHSLLRTGENRYIAATRNGIFVYDGKWHTAYEGLVVNDLKEASSGVLIASVGNGSRSDALLIGKPIIKGPPYYEFERLQWLLNPGPLALKIEEEGVVRVYAYAQGLIHTGRFKIDDPVLELKRMAMPSGAFGVEDPHCLAFHVFTPEQRCYAGGMDRSPLPGPAWLVREESVDSMAKSRRMNITALTEKRVSYSMIRDTIAPLLVAGTPDSGVYTRFPTLLPVQPGTNWRRIPTPQGQAVHDLIAVPSSWNNKADALRLAVKDGVYEECPPNADCQWAKIGDIEAVPRCLCYGSGVLAAGTDDGVLVFAHTSRVRNASGAPGRGKAAIGEAITSERPLTLWRIDGRAAMVTSQQAYSGLPRGVYIIEEYRAGGVVRRAIAK